MVDGAIDTQFCRGRRSRRVAHQAPEEPPRRRSARDNGAAKKSLAEPGSSDDDDFLAEEGDSDGSGRPAAKRPRLNRRARRVRT